MLTFDHDTIEILKKGKLSSSFSVKPNLSENVHLE